MRNLIDEFKSKVDSDAVISDFPEITETETPIWRGGPTTLSMLDKYSLAVVVLAIHLVFFAGDWLEPEGEGSVNFAIRILVNLVDFSGVLGFLISMLVLTKINHYANFSTSGSWTTSWLLIISAIPAAWKVMDFIEWIAGFAGSEFSNPLPSWNHLWFAILGIFSFVVMSTLTVLYQRSFDYAITDKRIHIRKNFLFVDSSVQGISFHKIENLKADPTILGKILGYGNVHVVTGSGVGLQVESIGVGVGIATDSSEPLHGFRKVISAVFGLITKQRQRTEMSADPANCLYGVKSPMDVYRLINELMDNNVGPPGTETSLPGSE